MEVRTSPAQIELNIIKSSVIGILYHNNTIYLVVHYNEKNKTVDAINITQFGAIQKNYAMPIMGKFELFPNNQNMNQMLDHIFEWTKFIAQFHIK